MKKEDLDSALTATHSRLGLALHALTHTASVTASADTNLRQRLHVVESSPRAVMIAFCDFAFGGLDGTD